MDRLTQRLQEFDKNIKIKKVVNVTMSPQLDIYYYDETFSIIFTATQIHDLSMYGVDVDLYTDQIINLIKKSKYYLRTKKLNKILNEKY